MAITQKDKDLLLKDICARLPYNVKIQTIETWSNKPNKIEILKEIFIPEDNIPRCGVGGVPIEYIKPYLFPLSSMTPEQENEWNDLFHNPLDELFTKDKNGGVERNEKLLLISKSMIDPIQWCYKNHFDVFGLIPMGLANDATGLNIY